MEKTMKFEGFVNGQKFTDRESYNARIAELAAAGESINASSTLFSDICSGCREYCDCNCNGCTQPDESKPQEEPRAQFVLPYVNDDMTVAEDEVSEAGEVSDVEKRLRSLIPDNIRAISQMSLATRSKLLDDLEQIEKNLDEYEEELDKKAKQLAQEYLNVCAQRVQTSDVFTELRGFMKAMSLYAKGKIDEAAQAEEVFKKDSEIDSTSDTSNAAEGLVKLLKSLLS